MIPPSLLLPLLLAALSGPAAAQFMVHDYDNNRLSIESSSYGNNLYTSGNITSTQYGRGRDVYASNGWLRNSSAGGGLYNEALFTYFFASVVDSTGGWNMASNSGSIELSLRSNHDYYTPTVYGSIYGDGTNFGLKNSAGTAVLYAASNGLARIPGSLQIGGYGVILDNTTKTHASAVLDGSYDNFSAITFGPNASSTVMWASNIDAGAGLVRGGELLELWTHSTRTLSFVARLYANVGVEENGRPVLTKVAYRMHCNGGNAACYPPNCADGTAGSTGCNVLSGGSFSCYRDCCWGND
jgi:hypothetical protein